MRDGPVDRSESIHYCIEVVPWWYFHGQGNADEGKRIPELDPGDVLWNTVGPQRAVGVDIIVAQGTEAGGHTGQIATMVLVPQVVDVAGPDIAVLAAGGISRGRQIAAAFALGAQGVWTGTISRP